MGIKKVKYLNFVDSNCSLLSSPLTVCNRVLLKKVNLRIFVRTFVICSLELERRDSADFVEEQQQQPDESDEIMNEIIREEIEQELEVEKKLEEKEPEKEEVKQDTYKV